MVFSSIIEGGAGTYKEFLDISMLHSVVIPTSLSVNKRLSNAERAKFELSVNSKEGQALIGNLLGDCWLSRNKSKKTGELYNTRLDYTQSVIHSDYFYFVYSLFKLYCQSPPVQLNRFSKLTGPFSALRFQTLALPCFNFYHDLFYNKGKKNIPLDIIEYLTPISFANWIQDDGGYHVRDHILTLYTNGYTEPEVDLLIEALRKKFDLKCRKERKGTNYQIVIIKSSMDKVRNMVLEHFDKSMYYKLGVNAS